MKNLRDFTAAAIKDGYAAFNIHTGETPESGLSVATGNMVHYDLVYNTQIHESAENSVRNFVRNNGLELEDPDKYVQAMLVDDILTMTVVEIFHKEETAVRTNLTRRQSFLYDLDREILFPTECTPQKCGTETQKLSSMEAVKRQLVTNLKAMRRNV